MGSFSLVHWLILGIVLVLVLGGGRFSSMMGDVAKGIKQFKKGMAEEDDPISMREPSRIDTRTVPDPAIEAERLRAEKLREDR